MTYSPDELLEHYRLMVLIRRFEEVLANIFSEGLIGGTSHFCVGQEACAVGGIAALGPGDLVTSNHRGHGHFLAKGGDTGRIMAELFGKATGYSAGRGGSQHMADFGIGFLGSNGITGGMIPVATGAALTQKLQHTGKVVLCFFGDGACGNGSFHEGVNMGAIWDLPVVYFIENNAYAMSTPVSQTFKIEELSRRAEAYGIPGVTVDGNDYFAVREATQQAVQRAREGRGPSIVEARTYRHCGHSKSDKCEYRPKGELEWWLARDPLGVMAERLLACGVTDGQLAAAREQVEEEVAQAVEFARQSPEPDAGGVARGVFATAGLGQV
ncbi:MAG: thiamine pyrophosphate-dependent dehydrogenase E1 component subunit alpha [Armatimonadia bacterium]